MLPTLSEIEQAAIGCWMLVLGDDGGKRRLDLTMRGFWRSFIWALPIAILDAVELLIVRRSIPPEALSTPQEPTSAPWLLLNGAIASVLAFFVYPAIVAGLARFMGLAKGYPGFIATRNWLIVFLGAPLSVIDILVALGTLPIEIRVLLNIPSCAIFVFADTRVARIMLETSWSLAFGFAFLDFLLGQVIGGVIYLLLS